MAAFQLLEQHPPLRLIAIPNIISPQLNLRLSRSCKRSWPACTVSDQTQRYFPPAVSGSSNEKLRNSCGQKLRKWYPSFASLSLPALAVCLWFQKKWFGSPCIPGSQPCHWSLHTQSCRSRCKARLKDPFLLSPLVQLSHIPETILFHGNLASAISYLCLTDLLCCSSSSSGWLGTRYVLLRHIHHQYSSTRTPLWSPLPSACHLIWC